MLGLIYVLETRCGYYQSLQPQAPPQGPLDIFFFAWLADVFQRPDQLLPTGRGALEPSFLVTPPCLL